MNELSNSSTSVHSHPIHQESIKSDVIMQQERKENSGASSFFIVSVLVLGIGAGSVYIGNEYMQEQIRQRIAPYILYDCSYNSHTSSKCSMSVDEYRMQLPLIQQGKHNQKLEDENRKFMEQKDRMVSQRDSLKKEVSELSSKNKVLLGSNENLKKENTSLKREVAGLKDRMSISGGVSPKAKPEIVRAMVPAEIEEFRKLIAYDSAAYDFCANGSNKHSPEGFLRCANSVDSQRFNKLKFIQRKKRRIKDGCSEKHNRFPDYVHCVMNNGKT